MPLAISHRTQTLAVDLLTGWSLREIATLFASHEMPAPTETLDERRWAVVGSSVRRDLAARHHAALDLRDPTMRARLLRVYNEMLLLANDGPAWQAFIGALEADGVRLVTDKEIDPRLLRIGDPAGVAGQGFEHLTKIRDPEVLREHARRMQRALEGADPADAILGARELLESTCHMVIEHYGESAPKNPSLGQLYGQVAVLLDLKASAIEGETEASKAARQVLQGLMSIAVGMGELRTRVGRGHGRTATSPARQRHAELATNAAGTLALFVLDTWHERVSVAGTAAA